jgi:hypothetical protein
MKMTVPGLLYGQQDDLPSGMPGTKGLRHITSWHSLSASLTFWLSFCLPRPIPAHSPCHACTLSVFKFSLSSLFSRLSLRWLQQLTECSSFAISREGWLLFLKENPKQEPHGEAQR